jgi:hypothetical protein
MKFFSFHVYEVLKHIEVDEAMLPKDFDEICFYKSTAK